MPYMEKKKMSKTALRQAEDDAGGSTNENVSGEGHLTPHQFETVSTKNKNE